MKVLFIADPGAVGGATRSLIDVVQCMKSNGVEVIVCNSVKNSMNDELYQLGIENFSCGHKSAMNTKSPYHWKRPIKYPYELLRYYISLPNALKTIKKNIDLNTINIIHTNSARNDIGCILSKKYKIPHVMHIREFGQEDFDCCIYRPNYYKYISKYSNKLIAISKAVASSWISKGVDKNKLKVIYNGVNNLNIKKKRTATSSHLLKLIIVGGVCEPKGQLECVEAIHLLEDEVRSNIHLDIIGWTEPIYEQKLRNKILEYNLGNTIDLQGVHDDVYTIIKNYDVGLMCSKSEGFGRVTVEYMFAGLAVIASNRGANCELIKDGEEGIIYRKGIANNLANAIKTYYYDRDFMCKCAIKGQIKAEKCYTIINNVRQIMKVYDELYDQYEGEMKENKKKF